MGKVRFLILALLLVPLMGLWSQTLDYVYGTSLSSKSDGSINKGDMFITDASSTIVARKILEFDNQEDIVIFDSLFRAEGDFIPGEKIYRTRRELSVSVNSGLDCTLAELAATTGIYPLKPFACLGIEYGDGMATFLLGGGIETTVFLGSLFDSSLAIVANTGIKAWASPFIGISSAGFSYGLFYGFGAQNRIGMFSAGLGLQFLVCSDSSPRFSPSVLLEVAL